jgi:transcriptional regulator NrdR family protein
MHCPICDTPASKGNNKILMARIDTCESRLRQRKCNCGHRWWTLEVELPPHSVKWAQADIEDATYSVPKRKKGALRVTFS